MQSEDCRERTTQSALEKYGVDHHLKAKEVQQKREETNLEKYGVQNVFASNHAKEKMKQTMIEKYGSEYPSQVPEIRSRQIKNAKNSKLEQRICRLFDNYNIKYIHHYHLSNKETNCFHEFDFYLPKYKILIDADGLYYHSYISDPDGKHFNDYYDDIRMNLVPRDHQLYIIVEGDEDKQVLQIVKILDQIDSGLFDYDSYLFRWCRSIEFPYVNYTDKRLENDWSSLCKYQNEKYINQCRIGESIIKQFHKSIYDCKVNHQSSVSPIEAWYDDEKLKKVIKNRLIYANDVDPSKILKGFNVSKICPVVSIFNPILAKYLINKYLLEFSEIFDPFSGFSGRLLGAASATKRYIGQDLNEKVVRESQQIIDFLHLDRSRYSIIQRDMLKSSGEYECLLTCPPYDDKEIYNQETVFKSCDEWIDECLSRFRCKRYVFVVDSTSKYQDCIKEVLKSTSHFCTTSENVIVIDK